MARFAIFAIAASACFLVGSLGTIDLAAPPAGRADLLSPLTAQAQDQGPADPQTPIHVAVTLRMADAAGLDAFIASASDPASPQFQHWLSLDDFNAHYGPGAAAESAVVAWLSAAGFGPIETFPNHMLVSAYGNAASAQAAFGTPIHALSLGGQPHYGPVAAPVLPAAVSPLVQGVSGLDDLVRLHPMAAVGGSCCSFSPGDLKTFYANTAAFTGAGQTLVIAGAYEWLDMDVSGFDTQFGLPALPAASAQVCTGLGGVGPACVFDPYDSLEVSLDVESAHGTAPGAAIKNYMSRTTLVSDFQVMYNTIASANPGHTVSTSWGSCEAGAGTSTVTSTDSLIAAGVARGQTWFAASGDNGSDDCKDGSASVDSPADSPHVMGVGGTSAHCSTGMSGSGAPNCGGYGSESAWSGSGGGKSAVFGKPTWQTGCSVPADGKRDVPDVSLAADSAHYGSWVLESDLWWVVGGTSDAAPQWAGLFAEINQRLGGAGLGNPGTRLYAMCGTTNYHDVTTGSNGVYSAGTNFDLVTGLGTPIASALVPGY